MIEKLIEKENNRNLDSYFVIKTLSGDVKFSILYDKKRKKFFGPCLEFSSTHIYKDQYWDAFGYVLNNYLPFAKKYIQKGKITYTLDEFNDFSEDIKLLEELSENERIATISEIIDVIGEAKEIFFDKNLAEL